MLTGSVSRGMADEVSDIEMLVVTREPIALEGATRWPAPPACGADPMMDAVQAALPQLGVPAERVHTERFNVVWRRPWARHVQMTRLVWLTAALIVIACVVFAAAQS